MRIKNLALLTAALLLATLTGCGSSRNSDGSSTSPGTTVPAGTVGSSSCKVCHTTIAVDENFNGSEHDNDAVAGCEGCHGGGQFHKGVGAIPVAAPGPDECIQCHSLATMTPVAHVDDPTTPAIIEGLVVKLDQADGCQSCHYSNHDPELIANTEWSNSAHGGHIATGPVTSATADAWVHYNWDDTSTRGSCQRCHTATGISNFLNDPAGYAANGSGNDFSHLLDWSATGGSGEQELLFCWGCHSDTEAATPADPKLRNPGAITETYTATTTGNPPTTVTYPNVGPSNVCMGCHLGREIGANIANDTDADGVRSFINSHYLTAGGTIFNTSGYEYAGQTYSNFGFHKQIGVGDAAANFNTGSSGPCVACHMSAGQKGHTFVFVTKTPDGAIESNESPICTNCHAAMDGDTLEATKESFNSALEELNLALQARGIFFFNAHPYFYKAAGGTGGAFTDWNSVAETLGVGLSTDPTGTGWKNVMGAAFNFNLFEHDPGAYAHNSDYALKLIADSIDFLDNGLVDASAASAASGLIGQGMNIASGAGYSPIHNTPMAVAAAAPTTSQATCSACHPAAPHYGGYPALGADGIAPDRDTARPQWVNNQVLSCAECHGDSAALNQPVLTQYAESGHGDILGAWTHEEAGGTCGRCHTTTGFINHLVGAAAFSYGASDPLQTLNCNGCHSSIVGEGVAPLRASAAFTATWSRNSVTASLVFPDVLDSNLCVRCHSARYGAPNITPVATVTSHYLPAAGIVFGGSPGLVTVTANTVAPPNNVPAIGTTFTGGGYEFAGQVYDNLGPHKTVGLGVGDTRGPCVGCHMSGTSGHTWNAVTKNETTGEVTSVNSAICADCHGATMTPAALNAAKGTFDAALDLLDARLQARGIFFNEADGRFYSDAAFTSAQINNAYYATQAALAPAVSTRDLQGAAYNLWLFKYHGADPAGYVHNGDYARELIADSADLLNDGAINGL